MSKYFFGAKLEDIEGLGLESLKNSFTHKNLTTETDNFIKNQSNDFRIRPQSSMPRFIKK